MSEQTRWIWQTYDQSRLVDEVQALLRERGLTPDLPDDRMDHALEGAQRLLAAMGIVPTMRMEIALSLDRPTSLEFE